MQSEGLTVEEISKKFTLPRTINTNSDSAIII